MGIAKMTTKRRLYVFIFAVLCTTLFLSVILAASPAQARSVTYKLDIPAQNLKDALQAFALASQHKLLYSSELVDGERSPALKGLFTTEQAVKVLLSGTNLGYEVTSDGLLLIRAVDRSPLARSAPTATGDDASGANTPAQEGKTSSSSEFRLAQANPGSAQSTAPVTDINANSEAADSGRPSGALNEIVVTATRRQERLQDVPISVTALSQETLDLQGARSIDDVTRLAPGVTFERNGTASNYNDEGSDINIRGIDSNAGTSTTGIYVNDTPIQSRHLGFGGVNAFPVLFDLDRVEVLRGPQGTLFGAGAEGGVLRFITPSPSLTADSGYVRSELATTRNGDPSYEAGAAIGGPLIDDVLGFRVSASFRRDGGYVDRVAYVRDTPDPATDPLTPPVYTQDIYPRSNWQQTSTFRGELKWAPTDTIDISPSFYYQELYINDTSTYWPSLSDPSASIYRNGNLLPDTSTDPFWLAAAKVDWNLDFARLTSNTSYYSRDQHSTSDYTQYLDVSFLGVPFPTSAADAGYAPFEDKQSNFYQEIRLASKDTDAVLVWNVGMFYAHMNENVAASIIDPTIDDQFAALNDGFKLCTGLLGYPCPNGVLLQQPVNRVVDRQIALFGELNWRFTDTLKLTAGLRAAKVDFSGATVTSGALAGGPPLAESASASERPLTPKGVISWQPSRDDLFYVSVAKGYRVGGVNTGLSSICGSDLASIGIPVGADGQRRVPEDYSSDSLWSYELGGKSSLLSRHLQIDWSIFLVNWNNIQQNVYLPTCGQQFVANLGKVQSRGGDVDIRYLPVERLTLALSAAYTEARFSDTVCAGALAFNGTDCGISSPGVILPIVSKGNQLPAAPWTFLTSAEYVFPSWKNRAPYIRADFQYAKAQTGLLPIQDPSNGVSDVTIPGLPVIINLNVRAGMRWSGVDLSIFANNLTDTHPVEFVSRDIAEPTNQLYFARGMRPRTIGITGTYRY